MTVLNDRAVSQILFIISAKKINPIRNTSPIPVRKLARTVRSFRGSLVMSPKNRITTAKTPNSRKNLISSASEGQYLVGVFGPGGQVV